MGAELLPAPLFTRRVQARRGRAEAFLAFQCRAAANFV
jgi:hypothetical protein